MVSFASLRAFQGLSGCLVKRSVLFLAPSGNGVAVQRAASLPDPPVRVAEAAEEEEEEDQEEAGEVEEGDGEEEEHDEDEEEEEETLGGFRRPSKASLVRSHGVVRHRSLLCAMVFFGSLGLLGGLVRAVAVLAQVAQAILSRALTLV